MDYSSYFPLGSYILQSSQNTFYWNNRAYKKALIQHLIGAALENKKKIYFVYRNLESISDYKDLLSSKKGFSKSKDSANQSEIWQDFLLNHHLNTDFLLTEGIQRNNEIFPPYNSDQILEHFLSLDETLESSSLDHILDATKFEFSKSEYYKLAGRIKHASDLYKTEFQFLDRGNVFSESVFINKEGAFSISVLLKYINNFQTKCKMLSDSYSEFLATLSHDHISTRKSMLHAIMDQCKKLQYNLDHKEVLKNRKEDKFWKKEWQDFLDQLSKIDIKSVDTSSILPDFKDRISMTSHVRTILNKLKIELSRGEESSKSFLKGVNIKSYDNRRLQDIEKQISDVIKSINDSQIFKDKIENNAISSVKQFQKLQQILGDLRAAQNQLKLMGAFYNWKAFLVGLTSKEQTIIQALIGSSPNQWSLLVEKWYFKKLIDKNSFSTLRLSDEKQKNYLESSFHIEDDMDALLSYFLSKTDSDKIQFIEDTQVNSNTDHLDLHVFVDTYPAASIKDKMTYVCICQQTNNQLPTGRSFHHKFLQNDVFQSDLDNNLQEAKYLAELIIVSEIPFQLFISNNANYLLHCSAWKIDQFLQSVDSKSLKSIRIKQDAKESLVEFFLNRGEEMYYVYDHFFSNIQSTFDLFVKQQVLLSLQKSGYRLVNADSRKFQLDPHYFGESLQPEIDLVR